MQKVGSFYLNFFIVILIAVAAFVIFTVYSQIQENKSAANWEKTFGRIEDLPNQYPYRNDNEAADQLKTLAVQLGIDFNMQGEGNRFTPLNLDAARLKGLYRERSAPSRIRYDNYWKNDDLVYIPSPLMSKYLTDYGKKLDAVKDYLLTSSPIEWRQNLHSSRYGNPNAALPNLEGISSLQELMTLRMLEFAAHKNYQEAEKYLEAKWTLNDSLRSRRDFESQEYALRNDKWTMSSMRKLPLDQNWIPTIVKHDYKKSFMESFRVAVWFYWRQRNEYQMTKSSVLNNILDPYLRLGVSSQLENDIKELQRLQAIKPCDIGYKELRESRRTGMKGIPYNWYLYESVSSYAEITEIELLRELTSKVIRVKQGYFPKDGMERSEACKDGTWEYWRSADGVTIKYNGRIELPYTAPSQFPSPFTVKTIKPH